MWRRTVARQGIGIAVGFGLELRHQFLHVLDWPRRVSRGSSSSASRASRRARTVSPGDRWRSGRGSKSRP
jgi:hypothetical protein